jgi:uncharacterized protein (TIGR02453 family)
MKNVLQFLQQLKENNNKEWFTANKKTFDEAQKVFKQLMEKVGEEFGKYDMVEKPKVFRIYRDVRFSPDKTPYKNNFGSYLERSTKLKRGGYYLHISPGESFVGGGFWQPEPNDLKRIRDEFASDHLTINKIISDPIFQKYFTKLDGEALKRPPKGYDPSLPAIELIKHKGFVATYKLSDKEIMAKDFHLLVADVFKSLVPFHDYMSEVLTTNVNGELIV